ncbi:MAG TPA: 3-phosphoshikimate 1-carboxyvinyltransferase [Verrucomicrobiae bacterium]|nr:3-phosphoshikimate 1-carboxyvinyltransferase [Verrucomicrobiae bacterium]
MRVEPAARVRGRVTVPGDKSISHRALLLAGLAAGRSYLGNLSDAADVVATCRLLEAVGVLVVARGAGQVSVVGTGRGRWHAPAAPVDCANSGSTMRMGAGALAGHPLAARLDGDDSLRRRPMARVAQVLEPLGAEIRCAGPDGRPPLEVRGRQPLHGGITVRPPVASAQLKTAVLLAGISADGPVTVEEPVPTRDHTERLLPLAGIACTRSPGPVAGVTVVPAEPEPFGLTIPGDLSSAAALLALAVAHPNAELRCEGVGLNRLRTGILDILQAMGARLTIEPGEVAGGGEPVGAVRARSASLRATRVGGGLVPRAIDELPLVAVVATQAEGRTEIRDAAELRVKESDRVEAIAAGLRAMGAEVEPVADGLVVVGPTSLHGARVEARGDHRIAIALAVAACIADGPTEIEGAECVAVSYPGFFATLADLCG